MFIRMLAVLLLAVLLVGCPVKGPAQKPAPGPKKVAESNQGAANVSRQDNPGLPWHNNPAFLQARQESKTPVLLASYQATLPDPILDERHNISLAADYLRGTVVQPGQVFSLNSRIGRRSAARGFKPGPMYQGGRIASTVGGGVCKIASVIYNVAILANQEIVERHPHSMTVPYVPPGQDATISFGTKDFKFRNTTQAPILIWSQNKGGTLYMAFYGTTAPPQVRWIHRTLSKSKTWTEYTYDYQMSEDMERVKFEGSDGIAVHSWIAVTDKNGKETVHDLGISSYRPCPRVVVKGRVPE